MLHLLIAILFSAMIPVLLKYAHKFKVADEVVLSTNYFIAVMISLFFTLVNRETYVKLFETPSDTVTLIVIGIITGLMYYGGFYFYQKSVMENGISVSIAIGKMGIILPLVLSLIIWKEIPTAIQWFGIFLSLIAIALISIHPEDFRKIQFRLSLALFFLIGGLGDFFNKLFEASVGSEYKDLFLTIVFISAFCASLINTIKQKRITKKGLLLGTAVGFPNMLTAFFLISALGSMNAAVVFPTYSGGAIMLSMLYSLIVFKEKLYKKEFVAIALILAALLLINF